MGERFGADTDEMGKQLPYFDGFTNDLDEAAGNFENLPADPEIWGPDAFGNQFAAQFLPALRGITDAVRGAHGLSLDLRAGTDAMHVNLGKLEDTNTEAADELRRASGTREHRPPSGSGPHV
ncbi:hypothetical protein ABT075_13845 [Streptomyces sp. NPDC002677]|uniref:hypothetical protein n=1 Tax=Streptomyces sp. NPDC002677 TaxID=3154774 RepID=UPI003326106D